MAGAIVNKFFEAIGLNSQENEEEYYDDEELMEEENENEQEETGLSFFNRRNRESKVVNMPQSHQVRMVISQPTSFEQAEEICTYLKNRKSVIVNLEYVNKDVARRIVDVMSGAVHALDGHIQKVSNSIFLIAPTYYEISTEMARDEIKNKLSVSWLKNG